MENDVEVHLHWGKFEQRVGTLYRAPGSPRETVSFEYDQDWIDNTVVGFELGPDLPLGSGRSYPPVGHDMFSMFGDTAPDSWGRNLMRKMERQKAEAEGRQARTLQETDYVLGVCDITRIGALRFKFPGDETFQAPHTIGVPKIISIERLMEVANRVVAGDVTEPELAMIFYPGSSLGGARPKCSLTDRHGNLSIAKFPKDDDEYSLERWEAITLKMARESGIQTAEYTLEEVKNKPVMVSRRFDRNEHGRIPFVSAMTLLGMKDGQTGCYLDIVDAIHDVSSDPDNSIRELFRRVVFNILVSNVDDHLKNHGFLRAQTGWELSPAYDINPVPQDIKSRILSTEIDYGEASCSLQLLLDTAEMYNLRSAEATQIVKEVLGGVEQWRSIAANFSASPSQIKRMESAFEHDDLVLAQSL